MITEPERATIHFNNTRKSGFAASASQFYVSLCCLCLPQVSQCGCLTYQPFPIDHWPFSDPDVPLSSSRLPKTYLPLSLDILPLNAIMSFKPFEVASG